MTIPLCQQCGKKLYASYGQRGYMAESDKLWHGYFFKTEEEHDAHHIPENAIDIDRTLIQKSGYFSRSAAPTKEDLDYIFKVCDFFFYFPRVSEEFFDSVDFIFWLHF